ncbi:STAS domain-containing protein [Dactylosporangium sp. CA-139066]|uniref:STAS domain-containing protein n=1 Tax=Dactylosporangium sp. CA-139066 TaxID=3239930 RepID=UPI003D90FF98
MPATDMPAVPFVEVVVVGALDAAAIPRMRVQLEDAAALRPVHMVVDLADCPRLDAAGIDLLVSVHRAVWSSGGRLTLRGMSSRLYRLLALARVDRVLQTAPTPAGYEPRHRSPGTSGRTEAAGTECSQRDDEVRWWETAATG